MSITKNATLPVLIHDFVNSNDPIFIGKTKSERIRMAMGAYYGLRKKALGEEAVGNVGGQVAGIPTILGGESPLKTVDALTRYKIKNAKNANYAPTSS
jgi:hypothetical protein